MNAELRIYIFSSHYTQLAGSNPVRDWPFDMSIQKNGIKPQNFTISKENSIE